MKLKKIYEKIIREGIAADPRDKKLIQEYLQKQKERYQSLSSEEKISFDKETLTNPYADSRLLNGDPDAEIKTAIVGIDIDSSELLFINNHNKENKKQKIDLAVSHHPQGIAYASFYEVMDMQSDIFHNMGVPINIAEGLVEERKKEVGRKIHAANHHRVTDMAKLLNIPFMCAHTPADNHAVAFLDKTFEAKKPQRLEDIMSILDSIEEYKISKREHVAPNILFGKPSARAGKLFVDMTGGTEGPKDIVDNLLQAGVGTLVGMHLSEEHYKKFKGKHINVIIAGHIASDNLGLNLLLDKIEKTAKIKILSCSGFRRIKR
ncbi:MAG: NGG1p interacting factor NIF3 [Candidatus Omnitrophota bacterium]